MTALRILSTLSKGDTSVNKVVEKTGVHPGKKPDKGHAIEVITHLEKKGVIRKDRDSKHKQKKILKLTALGKELAEFSKSLNEFKEAFSSFQQSVATNFDIDKDNDSQVRSKLLSRRWSKGEIDAYYNWSVEIGFFQHATIQRFLSALSERYLAITVHHNPKGIAKEVLERILQDGLDYLSTLQFDKIKNLFEDEKGLVQSINESGSTNTFNYVKNNAFMEGLDNRFIRNVKDEVISSIYSLSNPDKKEMGRIAKEAESAHQSYYQNLIDSV